MRERTVRSAVIWGLFAIIFGVILWVVGKYILFALMPFVIAFGVSLVIRPLSFWLSQKTGSGQKFWAVFLVIIILGALFLSLFRLGTALLTESRELIVEIGRGLEREDNILRRAIDFFSEIKEKIPFLKGDSSGSEEAFYKGVSGLISSSLESAASRLASGAAAALGKLPGLIFALVTTVISVFYITLDSGELEEEIVLFSGRSFLKKLKKAKVRLVGALSKYLKSYLLIMLLTFFELLVGFLILDLEYSVLAAFVISAIDILPILGSGIVLVPWGLCALAMGNVKIGAGLLVLWALMYIVRQIAEPKIIGKVMGIHPLFSLAAIYFGYIFFGFSGMVLLPLLVYTAKAFAIERNLQNVSENRQ